MASPINIGIVGLGNVGGGTLEILADNCDRISRKLGRPLAVKAICSRSIAESVPAAANHFPDAVRTADWREVVKNLDVQIVVELVGGTTVANEIIEASIANGKSVVTANKELMAQRGAELWQLADAAGVGLAMEASVAGGIPILTALREGIAGDRIEKILAILNGTCNFILTEMERRGDSLDVVLAEAQQLGYAEADPTADIDGFDARAKLALLAALTFGVRIKPESISTEGIRRIRDIDFLYANRLDHTVRLVASAADNPEGLFLSVRPALLPRQAILSSVSGSYNAIWAAGAHGADTFHYGRGAGPTPTGVAVVSDLIALARELVKGEPTHASPFAHIDLEEREPTSLEEEVRGYYLRFRVRDRPGIIAELARLLAAGNVSVDAVLQEPSFDKADLPFVITTEPAPRRAILQAVASMARLDFLVDPPLALPLEPGIGS
jgi:homoserine dehydrogenase